MLNQKFWRWDPSICVLARPPGDRSVLFHALCAAGQLLAHELYIKFNTLYLIEFELAFDVSSFLSNDEQSGSQQLFHFWVKSSNSLIPLKCVLCRL